MCSEPSNSFCKKYLGKKCSITVDIHKRMEGTLHHLNQEGTYNETNSVFINISSSITCLQHHSSKNVKPVQPHFLIKLTSDWTGYLKGHSSGLCTSCSTSDYCLFIQQQMATSALHADRLSVTGRNGQISAAQPFRLGLVVGPYIARRPDADNQLLMLDTHAGLLITETTERLLEASSQRKHAKPAGLHSEAK